MTTDQEVATEKPQDPGFEEAMENLERITQQVESGALPLEKALEEFERGVRLAARCRQELESAEGRIQQLMADGGLTAFQVDEAEG